MEPDTIFAMAWHLTQLARILKAEVEKEAKRLPPPKPMLDTLNRQNEALERRKEAEYATEVNTEINGDNLENLLRQSLEDAKRKRKEEDDGLSGPKS